MHLLALFVFALMSTAISLPIKANTEIDAEGVKRILVVLLKYLHSPGGFNSLLYYKPKRIQYAETVGKTLLAGFLVQPTDCLSTIETTYEEYVRDCKPIGPADHFCEGTLHFTNIENATVTCLPLLFTKNVEQKLPTTEKPVHVTEDDIIKKLLLEHMHSPEGFHTSRLYRPTRIKQALAVGPFLDAEFYIQPTHCYVGSNVTFDEYDRYCMPVGPADHICRGSIKDNSPHSHNIQCRPLIHEHEVNATLTDHVEISGIMLNYARSLSLRDAIDKYLHLWSIPSEPLRHKLIRAEADMTTGSSMKLMFVTERTTCFAKEPLTFVQYINECERMGIGIHACKGKMDLYNSNISEVACQDLKELLRF